jgi:pyrroline-5-carboxylate reductase
LNQLGQVVFLNSQEEINKFTSIYASGTGFVYMLMREYTQAGKQLNIQSMEELDAEELTINLFQGAVDYLKMQKTQK